MSKYDPLFNYLKTLGKQSITLTFSDIEKILGCKLPPSAREYDVWWDNSHTQAVSGWWGAGYTVAQLNRYDETVTFVRRF